MASSENHIIHLQNGAMTTTVSCYAEQSEFVCSVKRRREDSRCVAVSVADNRVFP